MVETEFVAESAEAPDIFEDREDAGRQLAERLAARVDDLGLRETVVLGLPRGGVPVAAPVAQALDAPLDVAVVRKLGIPFEPEVAMGAVGEEGVVVIDEVLVEIAGVSPGEVDAVVARERAAVADHLQRFRHGAPAPQLAGRTALVVDDGIATGATCSAACEVARRLGAQAVVVAAPVGSQEAIMRLTGADYVVCLLRPQPFHSVGSSYRSFEQLRDEDVLRLLDAASSRGAS